jgi:hypothetical protein
MKLSFRIMMLLAIAGMFAVSCEKKSDKEPMDEYFEAPYADKSEDEVKEDLEKTGVELQESMLKMQDEDAIDVTTNLAALLANSSMLNDVFGIAPMQQMTAIQNGELPKDMAFSGLKSASEDPESIEEIWEMLIGEYNYDAALDSFIKTDNADAIVINFPGLEGETENNASLTVNNFSVFKPTKPVPSTEEIIPELPATINAELTFMETTVMEYSLEGSYEDNGVPTLINSVFNVGAFDLVCKVEHGPYSKATALYSLKYNDNILVEMYGEAAGDWSEENINNNYETVTETDEWGTWEYQEFYFENVVNNSNSYIQVMDVKVAGAVNIKELATSLRALEDEYDDVEYDEATEEEYAGKMVESINKSAKLVVVYASSKQKIALAEAYPKKYTYYNDWCECEETYWDMGVNMVFADGSKVDAEVYFTELFDSMAQDLDEFFKFLDQF